MARELTMKIEALDHFQIAAPSDLIALVRDFYVEVLGFVDGARPQFSSGGYWLYAGNKPLVHLRIEETPEAERVDASHSYCDHIALSCIGLEEFENRLTANEIPFTKNHIKDFNQYQLFCRDPAGVGVELNFQR
jgi:extradiol dioxygenase family protein